MLLASTFIGLALVGSLTADSFTRAQEPGPRAAPPATQPANRPVPEIKIDMDKAVAVELPAIPEALKPASFKTRDGRSGWVLKIPGDRPIATPAFAEIDGRGMVFVGGGLRLARVLRIRCPFRGESMGDEDRR